MDVQHVYVKFFVEHPERIDLTDYLSIFNEWIQDGEFEELLVDVADYRHVAGGPGVVLVGHEANYSMDTGDGRFGLLYDRKATVDGDARASIRQAIQAAVQACHRLEDHPTQNGKLVFRGNEMLIGINDRLLASNNEATFRTFEPELRPALEAIYGKDGYNIARHTADPRDRFAVHVTAGTGARIAAVQKALDR